MGEPFCLLPPCQNSWWISCKSGDYWVLKTTVMVNLKCWTYILNLSPGAIHMHSNLSLHAKTASLIPSVSLQRQKLYWDLLSLHFFSPPPQFHIRGQPSTHTVLKALYGLPPWNVGVFLLFSLQESPQQQTLTLNCAVTAGVLKAWININIL